MSFPRAVYLDTCVLRKLGKEITTPEYQEFKEICDTLDISIYIPKLVFNELTHYYLNDKLDKELTDVGLKLQKIRNTITSKEDITYKINSTKIKKDFKNYLINQIKKAEIEVIETPKISLNVLLDRAVKKVRPFKEKDKGFRDTIILYTVLKFAKNYPEDLHMLLSEDGDFAHKDIDMTASALGVKIKILKSLQEAKTYLIEFLKAVKKRYFAFRTEKLKEFLITNKRKIFNFIQGQGTFSEMFFIDSLKKQPLVSKELRGINKIEMTEPIDITNINMGFLPQEEEKGWVEISFMIKLNFFITTGIREFYFPQRFPIGQGKIGEESRFSPFPGTELKDEVITAFVPIFAEVLVNKEPKFFDLKFTKPPGY